MTVQTVPLIELHPHPIRTQLPTDVPTDLVASIKKKGVTRAPLIAPNGAVIDGQKVVDAAVLAGKTDIPVFVFDESWTDGIAHLAALHAFGDKPTPRRIWEIYTALKPFLYLRTAERRAAQLAGQAVPADRAGRSDVADALGVSEAEATHSIYLYNRTVKSHPDLSPEDLNSVLKAVEAGEIPTWTASARINDIIGAARAKKAKSYSAEAQTRALTGLTQECATIVAVVGDLGELHPDLSPDVLAAALEAASKLRTTAAQVVKSLRARLDSPHA